MRASDRLIVPLRLEGTSLLPPSSMAGREIIVLVNDGCPTAARSNIAVAAACSKVSPFAKQECLRAQTAILANSHDTSERITHRNAAVETIAKPLISWRRRGLVTHTADLSKSCKSFLTLQSSWQHSATSDGVSLASPTQSSLPFGGSWARTDGSVRPILWSRGIRVRYLLTVRARQSD
jgi:hypothetical protein